MTSSFKNTKIDPAGYVRLPAGTTAERPGSPTAGMMRFNSTLGYTEIYNGSAWTKFGAAITNRNDATGGIISYHGPYKCHTFINKVIFSDYLETAITDDATDSNYKVMKTFVATETGTIDIRFWAYIQSGTYYWTSRVRKNNSTVLGAVTFGGSYRAPASVHGYRPFRLTNMSVTAGDVITLEMVSSDGGGTPTTGNGQILYCKNVVATLKTYTFTPKESGFVEVLVVAGGGGGGRHSGAGGGAGGLIYNSAYYVTANTSYSVTVGHGGFASYGVYPDQPGYRGTNGENSVFGTLTAIGGGGGAGVGESSSGLSGGSGGGASRVNGTAGAGTTGQGFAGGSANIGTAGEPNYPGAGGGGAGGVGQDAQTAQGGRGGPGLVMSIGGIAAWYAGGGGGNIQYNALYGGIGGPGGGGDGSPGSSYGDAYGFNGELNTGGGGGGCHYNAANEPTNGQEGLGGSGIVIVRYPSISIPPVVQTFTNPGSTTWTCPPGVTSVQALVVAGGGGGGSGLGSGGGGGGVIYHSAYPVSPGSLYTVTVGSGGTGGAAGAANNGTAGGNSVFGTLTAIGGGYGAGIGGTTAGGNGGSGGGGGWGGNGGSPTAGQGFAGGNSLLNGHSGGGGGAGGTGGSGYAVGASSPVAAGGPGLPFGISGSLKYYGGGGGAGRYSAANGLGVGKGGRGGIGGGGDGGGKDEAGYRGEDGTGGGGGGGDYGTLPRYAGANGGSGVVILSWYPQ